MQDWLNMFIKHTCYLIYTRKTIFNIMLVNIDKNT